MLSIICWLFKTSEAGEAMKSFKKECADEAPSSRLQRLSFLIVILLPKGLIINYRRTVKTGRPDCNNANLPTRGGEVVLLSNYGAVVFSYVFIIDFLVKTCYTLHDKKWGKGSCMLILTIRIPALTDRLLSEAATAMIRYFITGHGKNYYYYDRYYFLITLYYTGDDMSDLCTKFHQEVR